MSDASEPLHVQLGLFAGCAAVAGMHLVSAHERLLPDGKLVFVGEHLRWNRPRHARPTATRPSAPADDQPGLFDREPR